MIRTLAFVNTATYVWAISPYPMKLKRIRGYNGSATAKLWLQFHTGTQNSPNDTDISKPANTTVPLEEFPILAGSEVLFDRAIDGLKDMVAPVVAVLSTTSGTLTAATGESALNWFLDIEEYEAPPDSAWTTTQNTNASAANQIWAEIAAGTNKNCLYELVLNNNSGATAYLKIFPVAGAPVDGTKPAREFTIPANTAYPFQRLRFGDPKSIGYIPYQQGGNIGASGIGNTNTTDHYGCEITLESASGTSLAANALTAWKYQVKYAALQV